MEESLDAQCEPHLDVRLDNDFFPIIEDVTHEMFMPEVERDVQEAAPTVVVPEEPEPVVGEVPQQVVDEDVYHPVFEYVPDGCHLHNEGYTTDDEELDQFISLANMCRDEQLFTSYFESICQQQQKEQQRSEEPETEHQSSGQQNPEETGGSKRRRKYSPVVEKRNSTDNPLCEQENVDELQDLQDLEDLEGFKKKGIKYTQFKLTNELPVWKPGDIFGDRDFFYTVLRQYAIMTKRRVHVKKNDGKRLKGQGCQWYVYLRKIETHNDTDYVVMNLQRDHDHTCSQVLEQKWLTTKWLAERYMEKIKANPHIPLAAIRQCVDEEFGLKVGRMKAYRARDHALEGIFGKAGLQYRNLFYYKTELERTHPDSSVHIHYENVRDPETIGPRFLRFYCCLRPLKKGWMRFCRPIIFLDACFLRGMYRG